MFQALESYLKNEQVNEPSLKYLQKDNSKYKTELCHKFMTKGKCRYKNFCQYAHGNQELIPKSVKPTFRTRLCDKYHKNLTCAYGSRCQFKHSTYAERNNSKGSIIFRLVSQLKLIEREILSEETIDDFIWKKSIFNLDKDLSSENHSTRCSSDENNLDVSLSGSDDNLLTTLNILEEEDDTEVISEKEKTLGIFGKPKKLNLNARDFSLIQ